MRGNEAGGDTTTQTVGQKVGKRPCQRDVTGRKITHVFVVHAGLLHLAVIHILCCDTPCGTLLIAFDERCRSRLRPFHIGHEVQVQRLVAHAADKCRVMENQCCIVLGQRDVVTTQCSNMGTDGKAQKTVHFLALLCCCHKH